MYKDTKRKISVDYIKSEFDNEESFDLEKYIKNKYDIIPNNEQIIGDCDIDRELIQKWMDKIIEISDKKQNVYLVWNESLIILYHVKCFLNTMIYCFMLYAVSYG